MSVPVTDRGAGPAAPDGTPAGHPGSHPAPPTSYTAPIPARPRRGPRWPGAGAGGPDRGRAERFALIGLLAGTAVLYLWGLGASGWANAYYSAAVQAASESWQAFLFGSFDASNAITVDKPPASLWAMALSARVFGVNSWSILVPQALMGVATVALVYATVRRWFSASAALLAGAALAVTPVAVLMFRFNNPDAMLVLLLTGSAYATVRAVERASAKWLALAGALVGFAFLAKMMQAFLIVPPLALVYLIAAPTSVRRRLGHVLMAGAAMVASFGWWVALVELWPASSRPYVGGSQTNSILELIFGYNGLGRLTGNEVGSVGGGQGGGWGETGWSRMFAAGSGGQVAWLLPAALLLTVALFVLARRAPRTDRLRASALLWGGWLVVTLLVFSFMAGIYHDYYTVALAPQIAALVGIGGAALWERRASPTARVALAAVVAVSAIWSYVLLDRTPDWQPWVRVLVLIAGAIATLGLLLPSLTRRVGIAAALAGLVAVLAGPAAYAVSTASQAHTGSIVTAGPAGAAGSGRGGGMRGPGQRPNFGGQAPNFGGQAPNFGGGQLPGGATGNGGTTGGPGGGAGGGMGGLLNATTPGAELTALLTAGAGSYSWVAAAVGSQSAAGYQLATGLPVMAIGGFNGSDPSPTLAEFQQLVAEGKIHYFVGGGMGGGRGMQSNGGSSASSEIATWVQENFTAQTVDGVTLYDLTASA